MACNFSNASAFEQTIIQATTDEAAAGLCLCLIHFGILVHIAWKKKRSGFGLQIVLALTAICAQISLLSVKVYSYDNYPSTNKPYATYDAYVSDWLMNTFFAAYGYIIVALCMERYIAIARPISYCRTRISFQIGATIISLLLGVICASKWYHERYVILVNDRPIICYYPLRKLSPVFTNRPAWHIFCTALQFYVPACLMFIFIILTIRSLGRLERQYGLKLRLHLHWKIRQRQARRQRVTIRLCKVLAVFFCITNLPISVAEYDDFDWFGNTYVFSIFLLTTNVLQLVAIQANLVLYACCSHVYRKAIKSIACGWMSKIKKSTKSKRSHQIPEEESYERDYIVHESQIPTVAGSIDARLRSFSRHIVSECRNDSLEFVNNRQSNGEIQMHRYDKKSTASKHWRNRRKTAPHLYNNNDNEIMETYDTQCQCSVSGLEMTQRKRKRSVTIIRSVSLSEHFVERF